MSRTPIEYDPYLAGRSVEIEGGDDGRPAVIVKRTVGPGLRAARRELAAYRLGIAKASPSMGLRAPALVGFDEGAEHVEIRLELVSDDFGGAWPVSRFGVAARHIGQWNARTSRRPVPREFDSEDAWAERHGQPERVGEATAELASLAGRPGADELMALLGDGGFDRVRRLIESTPDRIARLAGFPQTLLHHDLVRSNLFALGPDSTAAIDWENAGRGPFGVDLAPLVIGSVRRGEASGDDLPEIERGVLEGYVGALAEQGIEAEADVRRAYQLAIALRWHVVLGTIRTWLDPTGIWRIRGSLPNEPREESLRHMIAVSRHILDVADASA